MSELMKCRDCDLEKPKTDYYKNRRKCKECMNNRVKKWNSENKDLHNEYCKTWRDNNKDAFNEYMRKYKTKNYDPEKKHQYYMKYRYGASTRVSPHIKC